MRHGCFFTYLVCVLAQLSVWFDPFLSFFAIPLAISTFPILRVDFLANGSSEPAWVHPPERDRSSLPFFSVVGFVWGGFAQQI